MAIAQTVLDYLEQRGITYDVIVHSPTGSSSESAQSAHVSGDRIAKGVVVRHRDRHWLAVLPGENYLDIKALGERLGHDVELAPEAQLSELFQDCRAGAVPALGLAYGIDTLVDESLRGQPELYFEAGDHESLIHVAEADFETLMRGAEFASFSHHKL